MGGGEIGYVKGEENVRWWCFTLPLPVGVGSVTQDESGEGGGLRPAWSQHHGKESEAERRLTAGDLDVWAWGDLTYSLGGRSPRLTVTCGQNDRYWKRRGEEGNRWIMLSCNSGWSSHREAVLTNLAAWPPLWERSLGTCLFSTIQGGLF